ncbi:MAG: hypothetical protein U5R06_17750 [candidate division KSB1 bacterium]|nr:hypothetical protein [candidate division KSB1 bacterium]
MPFEKITPDQITVYPVRERQSKSCFNDIKADPDADTPLLKPDVAGKIAQTAERIIRARKSGASVILAFGAHLIKNGLSPLVIRMMQEGWITHIATNGAGGIHDWEFAWMGRSEEDVRANVSQGKFGTWNETGNYLNLAVLAGAVKGMGYGESIGALIANQGMDIPDKKQLKRDILNGVEQFDPLLSAKADLWNDLSVFQTDSGFLSVAHPFKKNSVFGQAFELSVPATVHPGIGYDIIYNHPRANGAALGRGGHWDFQIMVKSVSKLSGGVFLSVGSAIMAPQVFEKAVSAANNVLGNSGSIRDHWLVVNDLQPASWDWSQGEPPKSEPDYYLRFLKSFYRMGGTVRYVALDNRLFLSSLYHRLTQQSAQNIIFSKY